MARERNTPWSLTPAQRTVLATYEEGEFAHLALIGSEAEFDAATADCGDGFLKAVLRELDEREDGDEDPAGRLETMRDQLDRMIAAVGGI